MYGIRFREELDEPTQRELDALISRLKSFLLLEHNEDGSHNFEALVDPNTILQIIDKYQDQGQWWKTGPWKLDDPAAGNKHVCGIRHDPAGGTYDNYSPDGIDTSFLVELEPQADITISGIKCLEGLQQKRLLLIRNRDNTASVTLQHEGTGSLEPYRFDLPDDADMVLGPDQTGWFYYDPARERWTVIITGHDAGPIAPGTPSSSLRKTQLHVTIDGNGSAITTGDKKVYIRVPFDFELNGWEIVADQSGSIVFDIWKDTYANFPPTVADTIIGGGGTKPTLSAAQKATSGNIDFYTTDWLEGEYIEVNVDSVSTVTKVNLFLYGRKAN